MDSRFPTHYLNDRRVLRASPPAFRQFVLGTAWSVSNMTDGFISNADLPLVQFSSPEHAAELVTRGLWNDVDGGYQIADFQKFQTTAAQMETALVNRRENDRKRQARKRSKGPEDPEPPMSHGQSRDGHVTSEGKSKSKSKRKEEEEGSPESQEEVDIQTGEIISTPSSAPGPSELFGDPPAYSEADFVGWDAA